MKFYESCIIHALTNYSLPVINRRPLDSCFKTITLFPLCTPASKIATAPGAKLALTVRLCLAKKFFDVPLGALKNKSNT